MSCNSCNGMNPANCPDERHRDEHLGGFWDDPRNKLAHAATEYQVCEGPTGGPGIILQERYAYGKPAGWLIIYTRSGNTPERVIDWDGMVVWDPPKDDRTEEHMEATRLSLEAAITVCDSLDLWSCRWVQGQGYVNRAGTWIGQNMHVTLRVPEWV